jgi:WD40 repeat protein
VEKEIKWDLASGEEITTFSGHAATALITGIAFSPDGKTVFTGADDKLSKVFTCGDLPMASNDKEASKLGCAQRGSAYCLS